LFIEGLHTIKNMASGDSHRMVGPYFPREKAYIGNTSLLALNPRALALFIQIIGFTECELSIASVLLV
jgi:hypothetical protein